MAEHRQAASIGHAERSADADILARMLERRQDQSSLALDSLDETRLITTSDQEVLRSRTQEAAAGLRAYLALVVLGVDHSDPALADGQVVDVRASPGNPAIVQQIDAVTVQQLRESSGNSLLALGAPLPRALMLWLAQLRHAGSHPTQPDSVPGSSRLFLTRQAPTLMFTMSARAGGAAFQRFDGADRIGGGSAKLTRDRSVAVVMYGPFTSSDGASARPALAGIPK